MYLNMKTVSIITLIMMILLSIAFFTLMERKLISYFQTRKGPNKNSLMGILQPISDAIKLMSKEMNMNLNSNFLMFTLSPMTNIVSSMILWLTFPMIFNLSFMKMSIIFVMASTSMASITVMMMSWSSNSNYALIGMIRTIAQMISYEINLMMILITMINLTEQMNMNLMEKMQKYEPMMIIMPSMMIIWMITMLAETNRTPFDFSEGESELISGFNVEFSSKSFMLLFLAEYSSILFMSMMTSIMFITSMKNMKIFILSYLSMCVFFIWTRSTLPRFRYDLLMKLNWIQLIPATTLMLMTSFIMKMY